MPVTPQIAEGAMNPPMPPAGPQGAPMAQPTPNEGARQMAAVQVEAAMQMLEQALPALGSNTEEGAAVLRAMGTLSKSFQRSRSKDLVPAQIAEMARAQKQSPIADLMAGGAPQGGGAPAPQMQ